MLLVTSKKPYSAMIAASCLDSMGSCIPEKTIAVLSTYPPCCCRLCVQYKRYDLSSGKEQFLFADYTARYDLQGKVQGSDAEKQGCWMRSLPRHGSLPGMSTVRQSVTLMNMQTNILPLLPEPGFLNNGLSRPQADRTQSLLVSPLTIHNNALDRYNRKYKPIDINSAM